MSEIVRVPDTVRQLGDFRIQWRGKRISLQGKKSGQAFTHDFVFPWALDGFDEKTTLKLLLLFAAYEEIGRELLRAGIIETDAMGCQPIYDLDPGTGCRYVPTPFMVVVKSVLAIKALMGAKQNSTLVDLGGGLGLPVLVATLLGFRATAFELSQELRDSAEHMKTIFPDAPELQEAAFVCGDFFSADLGRFDALYAYLWDSAMACSLMRLRLEQLPSGMIVCAYGVIDRHPDKSLLQVVGEERFDGVRKIVLYQKV